MWFNIITKKMPFQYKKVVKKLIEDYINGLNIGDEFAVSDIFKWGRKETELYESSEGTEGTDYNMKVISRSGTEPEFIEAPSPTTIQINTMIGSFNQIKVDRMEKPKPSGRLRRVYRRIR